MTELKRSIPRIIRAGGKAAQAKLREIGLLKISHDWTMRAEACERCPMRVTQCGISYCGKPFLQMPERDPATDGCGCPTRAKAKAPNEHCPLTARHRLAVRDGDHCDCKWCSINRSPVVGV